MTKAKSALVCQAIKVTWNEEQRQARSWREKKLKTQG